MEGVALKLVTWLGQSSPSFETLIVKLDYSESEPTEPVDGITLMAGTSELTTDEEWCGEQLYQLLVQKCEGPALGIIRNQTTKGKARGLIAWHRTLREAEGQVPQKRSEITEKVFQPDRKAVAPKDVVSTLEAYEGDIREYQILTGNKMDNTMMVANLKKMMPEVIRERLETLDLQTYAEAKEYAIKQARDLKKNSKTSTLYLNDDEEVGALEVLYHIVYDDGDEEDITLPQLFGILQDKNSIPEATRALLEQLAQAEASSAASGETAVVPWVAGVGDGAVIASGSQPAATAVAVKPEPEVRATFLRAKPPAIVSFAAWAWELYGRKQELAN